MNRSSLSRLSGRYGPWALVTGASDGIGRATADRLAGNGLNLVLVARRAAELEAFADELRLRAGVQAIVLPADLADPRATAIIDDRTRHLDIGLAVLAAGFGSTDEFLRTPLPTQREMIAVNVVAVTDLCHRFGRRFADRGRGGLVLFGSIVGWQGVPRQATYSASKAYVQTFAEALHAELADGGVDVLAVAPGPVQTGFGARAGLSMASADSADAVAAAILRAIGRKTTVVPALRGKTLTAALSTLPRGLRTRIMGRVIEAMHAAGRPMPTVASAAAVLWRVWPGRPAGTARS